KENTKESLGYDHSDMHDESTVIKYVLNKIISFLPQDISPPQNASVTINNGYESTNTIEVTLTLSATDDKGVTAYYASENSSKPSANSDGWKNFAESASFILSSGEGNKTVYVWFKDEVGNISEITSDSINFVRSFFLFKDNAKNGLQNWVPESIWNIEENNGITFFSDSPGSNYQNQSNVSLTLKNSINLTTMINPKLTIVHYYELEENYDYGYIEISNDGVEWTELLKVTGTAPYTKTRHQLSLSNYKTYSTAKIRLRLFSDSNTTNNGWHIYEIYIHESDDTQSPSIDNIEISNNINITNTIYINVNLSAIDNGFITAYLISENPEVPGFDSDQWKYIKWSSNIEINTAFALSMDDGQKTIYVWVKDGSNNISNSKNTNIYLQKTLPQKIVFVGKDNGNKDIYSMNLDGSDQKKLTDDISDDILPCLSPDRSKIAFVSTRLSNKDIYILNLDSTCVRYTYNTLDDAMPAWSPDGKKIVFSRSSGQYYPDIYTIDFDGTNEKRLTTTQNDFFPQWSPNSEKIAFISKRDGDNEIYLMNKDGTNQINLTNNSASDQLPVWSPNGEKIAFVSDRDGNNEIYLINSDSTNLKRLTNNSASDGGWLSFSPDGQKIAFESDRDGNIEIYIIDITGENEVNITNNTANDTFPNWTILQNKIFFCSNRDGNNQQIYIMDLDGNNVTNISNNQMENFLPSYSPITEKGGGCFITKILNHNHASNMIKILTKFRDNYLFNNFLSKSFVSYYYKISPRLLNFILEK
ncbi:PD40 domain-containing protein, partial [Candidatus Desantisbacteria bacterium]|nr:PD40 domain-containing protein [Candidatus Desantisbacteria bacterium]